MLAAYAAVPYNCARRAQFAVVSLRPDRPFNGVGVDLDTAVVQKALEWMFLDVA